MRPANRKGDVLTFVVPRDMTELGAGELDEYLGFCERALLGDGDALDKSESAV